MTLLAIETSTPVGSIAIGDGERLLAEVTLGVGMRHAEAVLPAVRFALSHARVELAHLEGVVVGGGPGSFTGVRIAAATAKGLVRALGVPLHACSSLLALAAVVAHERRPVFALLDARRAEVYAACYRFFEAGEYETCVEPAARSVDEVVDQAASLGAVFVGDGALQYRERFAGLGPIVAAHVAVPRASALLWLVARAPEATRVAAPAHWQPDYLRASGAERGIKG